MIHPRSRSSGAIALAALAWLAVHPVESRAQVWPGKTDPDGLTLDKIKEAMPEYFLPNRHGGASPEALPDVQGPGAVLTVGNVFMKVTNWGHCGNLFTQLSSDPAGQWPGASAVEYLSSIRLAVGAVNPFATDPIEVRRVSYLLEWRPKTLDPADKIYRAYDGAINGSRFFNDDGDHFSDAGDNARNPGPIDRALIDEDFLDGQDNDGDGLIDEDYGALGQQMFSFSMWDNTNEAVNTVFNEKHVPLNLECRQRAWAYSIAGFQDFDVIDYEIFNRAPHELDSLCVGFLVDMDCGPIILSNFFLDDFGVPHMPNGDYVIRVGGSQGDLPDPKRTQKNHDPILNNTQDPSGRSISADSALCPSVHLRINGFSIADDNGDDNKTPGVPSFLLFAHSTDPLGVNGPKRVGFRAFRSFTAGTPYIQGGNPTIDQQRFEFMTSNENIDPETGFISTDLEPGDTKGDQVQWCSVGMWRHVPPGGSISVTVGFSVNPGKYSKASRFRGDLQAYNSIPEDAPCGVSGSLCRNEKAVQMMDDYPTLATALAAQIAYEGIYERRDGFPATDYHGRETGLKATLGTPDNTVSATEDCPNRASRTVFLSTRYYSWFDFDCDYCTGVWDPDLGAGRDPSAGGLFHKTWNASAPPPNPNIDVSSQYNFTDNPTRRVVAAGDHRVTLAWDNLSETTPDPKSQWFDFRGYRVWKVADWTRPIGSGGPAETDWKLVGEYRLFDYDDRGTPIERNYAIDPVTGEKQCPEVFVPNYQWTDAQGNQRLGKVVPICLERGDLWDNQTGQILKPNLCFVCDTVPSDHPIFGPTEINSCGMYGRGTSYSHTFQNPGTYAYLCQRHAGSTGSVTVVAGAPDSVRVDIIEYGALEFSPAHVTIKPGGTVRWVNLGTYTHTVTSQSDCNTVAGCALHSKPCERATRIRYPIGRYQMVDDQVKNGFIYFYSVTAFDSTFDNSITTELGGRRTAVESDGVYPQASVSDQKNGVWVVPNPYKDFSSVTERPSAWDLIPNASDPTGRHIDFLGLPSGVWTIKIFTVSGDLVAELTSTDAVNESVRSPVKIGETPDHHPINAPGFNRQQDNPNDGQARWNLISKNGQDIVSGIYLFIVDSHLGTQRGKFVVIR